MFFHRSGGGISWLLVGLGNPGNQYAATRHNMGFMALDRLADREGFRFNKLRFRAWTGQWKVGDRQVLVMKPQTYMNLSGESVRDMLEACSVPVERLIVIFDDADLPAGRIRIRKSGSAGTHNGMRNIVYLLESDRFPRIKVGIGGPDREHGEDMVDFVLSPMDSDTFAAVRAVPDAVLDLLEHGVDHAMQEFNKFQPVK